MKALRNFITVLAIACGLSVAMSAAHAQITDPGWFQSDEGSGSPPPDDLNAELEESPSPESPPTTLSIGSNQDPANSAEAISPEIEALARGLENDPLRIFNYVHDHIRYVPYFGFKKGARLTLLEKSGNDFDQSALLISLFRAAGLTNCFYSFAWEVIPYESGNSNDLKNWMGFTLPNTNWTTTSNYLVTFFKNRGYPTFSANSTWGPNLFGFQRVWVAIRVGTNVYHPDPAFKICQTIGGINLAATMGTSSNSIMSAAAGLDTGNYATNVNESALRNLLTGYTTNLLGYLRSNNPNASVEEVLSGKKIVPSTNTSLGNLPLFSYTSWNNTMPLVYWSSAPTNMMTKLKISFAGTNYLLLLPQLQGQRPSLTFDSGGVARLWLDDELLAERSTTGSSSRTNVVLEMNHPHGTWNFTSNQLIDSNYNDQIVTNQYQRTNATYSFIYAFEPDWDWLRSRQDQLARYRQSGLAEDSREVVSETLNVMGLSWLLQTEGLERIMATQMDILPQYHHRLGRTANEKGRGYYVDVYMQVSSALSSRGTGGAEDAREDRYFDLCGYFESAFEHGVIEQLQSSNLVASSTVKMLQLANTNGQAVFMANSANWNSSVRSRLTNYNLSLLDTFINSGYRLLLPRNGSNLVASAGSWAGYGMVGSRVSGNTKVLKMLIEGGYNGGFVSIAGAAPNSEYTFMSGISQPLFNGDSSPYLVDLYGADPVNMVNGSFSIDELDLALGGVEPRGLNLTRSYNSTSRALNPASMSGGWLHNYHVKIVEASAPEAALGITTPAQATPIIAATCAAAALYNDVNPTPKNWLVTALIAKWAADQFTRNGISVSLGKDIVQFVAQPDGSYTPPAGSTMALLKTNSSYVLNERHGRAFKFNSGGMLTNIVDPYNQSLILGYDPSNRVKTVQDWKGRTLTFNYSGTPERLDSVTDGTRTVSYSYSTGFSPQGDLASVTDAEGKTHTFVYDTNHQIVATIDALNQIVTSNIYDAFGKVTAQFTEGDAEKKAWNLFWSGYENIEEDPLGGRRHFVYDERRRLIRLQDACSNSVASFYDGQDHVVMTVSPMNETNRFEFDGRHNLVRSIDPINFTNEFIYDSQDRLIRSVDARGNSTRFGYNSQHSMTGSTNGAGDWFTLAYYSDGTVQTRTDSGGATDYNFNANGHLSRITYPNSLGSEGFLNNAYGDVLSHTNARGFVTSFQYNNRRQLTNAVAPTNVTSNVGYDPVGNMQSSKDARGFTTTNAWSATRKLLATALPATSQGVPVIENEYDSHDWLIRTVNPLQHTATFTNDLAGRLTATTDPLQRTTRLGYDANGRQTAITNAAQEVTRQQWNKRGELTQTTDNANHTVKRGYDPSGNQILLTNRNGKVWQFQFDGANRLTNTITPSTRETSVTFNNRGLVSTMREPSGQTTTNVYDAKGRLTNRVDALASTRLGYDANNNVTNVVEQASSLSWTFDAYDRVSTYRDADGNLIQYRHDANGNLTNLIYPGNKCVFYSYDSLNRLTNVTDWSQRKTSFEYDLASRLTKIVRPNGSVREIGHDAAGQTTSIIEKLTNNFPIAFFRFNWNAASRAEWEFVAPLPHTYTPPTRAMIYNDDNQIATFNGNSVTHDDDGNMTYGPGTNNTFATYTFDARNRLLAVGGLQYGYDPAGNRTSVTNGATITKLVVNPNTPLSQVLIRVNGGVTNYYIHGLGLLYEVTETASSTNTSFYHYDYRGSTVALTDGNGLPTDRIEYSAYGTTTYRVGNTDTPFLFSGRYSVQTDPNGLLYMRARYYNPYICRFINADPSGFSGGLNFYAYADGNPISLIDPFGLAAFGETVGNGWFDRGFRFLDETIGRPIEQAVEYGVGKLVDALIYGPDRVMSALTRPGTLGDPNPLPLLLLFATRGESAIAPNAASRVVNAQTIQAALEGSTMRTAQAEVSIPAVERYVRMLESGSTAPAITVADGVIIDGNHRFIAGRVFGTEPPISPGTLSTSQASQVRPIQQLNLNPADFGNH